MTQFGQENLYSFSNHSYWFWCNLTCLVSLKSHCILKRKECSTCTILEAFALKEKNMRREKRHLGFRNKCLLIEFQALVKEYIWGGSVSELIKLYHETPFTMNTKVHSFFEFWLNSDQHNVLINLWLSDF